jgi:hypothetical protein
VMFGGAWLIIAGLARRALASRACRIAIVVAAVALAIVISYRVGKSRCAAVEARKNQELQQRAMVAAQERYRTEEVFHAREIQELQSKFSALQQQAARDDSRVAADLGSGRARLRFKVAARCPTPAATGLAPLGTHGPETADLAPETAAALYSIAADGDQAIRQLTALQEWARGAVRLCGGKGGR